MPEIVIRRSGKGWGGFVIAAVVLMVLAIARLGPKLARQDAQDREELERQRLQQIIESTTSEDYERLGRAMEESGALDEALEKIHRAAESPSPAQTTEPAKPAVPPALPD